MKKLVLKTLIFLLPTLLVPAIMIYNDPFMIWFSYDQYYDGEYSLMLNREAVCLELLEQNRDKDVEFDSYIFGDSRSQAFKIKDWETHLPEGSKGFHFDASSESIYGILKKLEYIDRTQESIANAVIVIDQSNMVVNECRDKHLIINAPALTDRSAFIYHKVFFTASMDVKFMASYFAHKFGIKKGADIYFSEMAMTGDSSNGDVWYWTYDEHIRKDSIAYYNMMLDRGVFYDRTKFAKVKYDPMSEIEKEQLTKIADILKANEANYHLVLAPSYSQTKIGTERINFVNKVFGKDHVHDYTGVNAYSEWYGNFYEGHHCRPHVARSIFAEIYSGDQ